ncbi:MAG: electron transfer flavoprotein subunit alpha/FixB family protein [Desulfamplus sp.]|nr:electron transfer flavoprotein subunit alpha/FixB family protein [Desulfamplus sp.]
MKKIAVIIETKDGVIKEANYGMIACAAKNESPLYAFIINENGDKFKEELGKHGIQNIVEIRIDTLSCENGANEFNPFNWSDALVQAVTSYEISTLFGLTTPMGKELLPRIAAQLDAPLVMDCLDVSKGCDLVKTSLYSGKTIATIKVSGDIRLFGIRPNVIEPSSQIETSKTKISPKVEVFIANIKPKNNIKLIESRKGDSSGNDLVAADVIISGGRAMKNGENFKLLHDCAEAIQNFGSAAVVGASRVAVDLGWVPYRMQVGQTGEKVSPKVYIACGISGSVQHFAGMKMSGMIIAINENINAAIMSNCDYFVEADLFDIVPAITEELNMMNS